MAFLRAFGAYLPERVVTNAEMAALAGCSPEWILEMSGIEERRFAADSESVADLAVHAARCCLERAGVNPADLGLLILASGSAERPFPGPASTVAHRLGLDSTPALDLPMASAGSLFGLALGARLAETCGHVLVAGAEKMSSIALRQPRQPGVAPLFGDGAGACLISPGHGPLRVIDSQIHSGGAFADELKCDWAAPLHMNGRSVILQASRRLPRTIAGLLERNRYSTSQVRVFLLHQANQNLLARLAQSLDVPPDRFFSNIRLRGNTSSASLLIAAAECNPHAGPVIFAAFGAGFHWGALLAE